MHAGEQTVEIDTTMHAVQAVTGLPAQAQAGPLRVDLTIRQTATRRLSLAEPFGLHRRFPSLNSDTRSRTADPAPSTARSNAARCPG